MQKPKGRTKKPFPIIGIGASAGGTEAVIELLRNLPADTDAAYVLVMHLAPQHVSILDQLLSRATKIPVLKIKNNLKVKPRHLYVIPENKELRIEGGLLKLKHRMTVKGQHMPINSFFRALAKDCHKNAIGIILSGTGSDGTDGLKEIKAGGGITFAQDEQTAKHPEMMRSAIASGCVDFVMSPQRIADEIFRISQQRCIDVSSSVIFEKTFGNQNDALGKIFYLLYQESGVDFTHYKHGTIMRRLKRRLAMHKLQNTDDYLKFLLKHPDETKVLYEDLLINVTSFFREPGSYDALKKDIFPKLIKNRSNNIPIRIWIPGCSSGEEAYSIAILLLEFLKRKSSGQTVQIFASDISEKALEKSRRGIYRKSEIGNISPQRLKRFFIKAGHNYQITKEVREICTFAKHNVFKDPPFSNIDLISCRNVMIYLGPILQQKVIPVFHYALKPRGFLILSPSESIDTFSNLFRKVDNKYKIYAKKEVAVRPPQNVIPPFQRGWMPDLPKTRVEAVPASVFDVFKEADSLILSRYAPAGVLVDKDMKILQFRGNTSLYLAPKSGQASLDLFKMTNQDLFVDVRRLLHKAEKEKKPVLKVGRRFKHNGKIKCVDIEVVPITNYVPAEDFFLIIFKETPCVENLKKIKATKSKTKSFSENIDYNEQQIIQLTLDLEQTRDYLQSAVEKYEATNEELKSSNEELQSSNEELQSTNEELETAKEELQSANEELTTLNEELFRRNEELSQINNDITNLFSSVNTSIVMLGKDLCIKRFNKMSAELLNFIPSDIGRHISHIKANVDIPDLEECLLQAIETSGVIERHVQDKAECWYLFRAHPYINDTGDVTGAILTLVDIDKIKRLAEDSRRLATVAIDSNDAITVQDFKGNLISWNKGARSMYGWTEKEALQMNICETVPPNKRQEMLNFVKNAAIGNVIESFVTKRITKDGRTIDVWLVATKLIDDEGNPYALATTERDITSIKKNEDALKHSEEKYRTLLENIPQRIFLKDRNSVYISCNENYARDMNIQENDIVGKSDYDFYPRKLAEKYIADDKRIMDRGIPEDVDEKYISGDRDEYVHTIKTPVKDDDGNVIGIMGIFRNITDQKKADQKIKDGEIKYKTIFEGARDGILVANIDNHTLEYANNSICKMLGYDEHELCGMRMEDIHPKDELGRIVTEFNEHAGDEKSMAESIPCLRKDGSVFYADVNTASLSIEGKHFNVGFFRDMTESKRLREELVVAERLAVLGKLAGSLSHELRNPLAAISGTIYHLTKHIEKMDNKSISERLDIVRRQTMLATGIVSNTLDFARPVELNLCKIDINEVVDNALGDIVVPKNITINKEYGQKKEIMIDAFQIRRAFCNILTNSIHSIDSGGMIRITTLIDKNFVKVIFEDNGSGISADDLERIFDPLFTTKSGGIGLGMFIVKNTVKKHGGTIHIESQSGRGTTAVVKLPTKIQKVVS
jgi:two-component system, chemotaxis family, CheB/CheR fusion protein